jgi:hypothetical protein
VVPIFIENGQVIVNVMINEQGPFPMMFDTGGVEVVPSETATPLGLEVKGAQTDGAAEKARSQSPSRISRACILVVWNCQVCICWCSPDAFHRPQ